MATPLITYDVALAAEHAERIAFMHAGHIVEVGPTADILARPRHPYTKRSIASTPSTAGSLAELKSIPGGLPDLRRSDLPPSRYSQRCERYRADCDRPLPRRHRTRHRGRAAPARSRRTYLLTRRLGTSRDPAPA